MKSLIETPYLQGKFLSGSTLKLIACVSMLVDHIAVVLLTGRSEPGVVQLYTVMRAIGRIAFPLFVFLLVEGFYHTRSVPRYLLRLCVFAFLSEIPFDLANSGRSFYWGYQNVFFTLFFGLAAVWCYDMQMRKKGEFSGWGFLTVVVFAAAAQLLHADYGALGILIIFGFYLYRGIGFWNELVLAFLLLLDDFYALPAIFGIHFYNGKRGSAIKWAFYAFYPVHFIILWMIKYFL